MLDEWEVCLYIIRIGLNGVLSLTSQLLSLMKSSKRALLLWKLDLDYLMQKTLWDLCWELGQAKNQSQYKSQTLPPNCCHVGIHVILGTWDMDLFPSLEW